MKDEKIYKAGTTIEFHWGCNFAGCGGTEEVVLEEDFTQSELGEWARDIMENNLAPEYWFKEIK